MRWLFLFLLLPLTTFATNHYVSSSTGSDSNPGTITQPWQTISKVQSSMSSFVQGDSILFKAGDTFTIPEGVNTGGLLVTVNGIVLSSYGTGAKPVITLPPITGWSGGPVYTASWTIQTCCSILFQDGVPLTKASSSACTDGNWYGASGVLYYKPTSGTPSNHTVTVANINNSYIPGIDLSGRQNVTVSNLSFNSLGIGIKTFETTTGTSGLTITNCTFNLCQSGVFMMPGTNNNTNASITNNLFYRCQVGVRLYTIAAIGGTSTAGTHINCTVTNNEMSQCGTTDGTTHWQSSVAGTDYEAIGVQNFMGGTISNNNIHDGYCIGLSWYNLSTRSSDNNVIQNNTIQNNLKGGMILIGNATYNYSYNNNFFSNNLFVNTNGAPGNNGGTIAIYPGTLTTVQSKFVNNTLSGSLNNIAFENSNAPQFLIENNIFSQVGANNFVAYGYSTKPASLTMDYNLYYPTTNWIMGSNKTLAQMQALGMEQHSLTVNPQLTSSYTLAPTSPAINAGTSVGLPYSGSAPDLGAYEYQPTNGLCGPFTNHAPIVLSGASNQTISGYSITCNPGAPGISLTNCHDIVIKLNYINGNCTPGQDALRVGIQLYNCYNIQIDSNKITYASNGVYVISSTNNITVFGNQIQNLTGPFPKGCGIQFNGVNGSGNLIYNNNIENLPSVSQPADAINIYNSSGTPSSYIQVYGNMIRETGTSASSISAGGVLLGDGTGSYQICHDNYCVNTGHFGVGIATGNSMTVQNNTVFVNDPIITNGVAVQIANVVSGSSCANVVVSGNQVNALVGVSNWIPTSGVNSCSPVYNFDNNWNNTALTANIIPAILIPQCAIPAPNISFVPDTFTYFINQPISKITPVNVGGSATSFSIVPQQPQGLVFSTVDGSLQGTPTAVVPQTVFKVSAVNSSGQSATNLVLSVNNIPPNISYSPSSQTGTINVALTPMPVINSGGAATNFTCSPNLPSGLILTNSGTIQGTPLVTIPSTNFIVTAYNSGGNSSATVNLTINPPAPAKPNISFSPSNYSFPQNSAIPTIHPINTGGTPSNPWSISPSLVSGLTFSVSDGSISGTPTSVIASTPYLVTASNGTGSSSATVNIAVTSTAPALPSFSYVPDSVSLTVNHTAILLSPESIGGAITSYTISPALPSGLSISNSTGVISGVSSITIPTTHFIVTGSNSTGSSTAPIVITVVPQGGSNNLRVHGHTAVFVN